MSSRPIPTVPARARSGIPTASSPFATRSRSSNRCWRKAGAPLALVGHSYGAAVALIAALAESGPRARAGAVRADVVLAARRREARAQRSRRHPRRGRRVVAALEAGNQDAAAECFIDYWMGAGAWQQTPEARKPPIAASVMNVRRWAHALMTEPDAAGEIPYAGHSGALHDRKALDGVGAWSGTIADGCLAQSGSGGIRETRPYGSCHPSRSGESRD